MDRVPALRAEQVLALGAERVSGRCPPCKTGSRLRSRHLRSRPSSTGRCSRARPSSRQWVALGSRVRSRPGCEPN